MKHLGTRTLETDRLILRAFVPEDAAAMFRNWAGDPEVTKFLTWPTHETEAVTEQVEVGYCIGRPWWHQGVMTECFSAVIRFLFEEVGVNRIAASHDVNNPHSGMVMKNNI